MKALTTLIATVCLFANAAIAAPAASPAPAGASQVGASQVGTSSASSAAAPAELNPLARVTISKQRSREEVRAEAVQAMKHHKTALAVQLEQYQ